MSSDTWRAMCHNAWQGHACVTHGMPCVNMHGSFKAYIRGCSWLIRTSKGGAARRRREGKEEGRKGEEKGRKGEEKRKEEKRRRKRRNRGKRKRKMKECRVVRRPRLQRTRNCATRGRFSPTLVILCLGAV